MNKYDKFKAGLASNADIKNILSTEYSERFDEIRKNMMIVSYYKYGPLKDNYGTYKCMNAIENLKIRLQKYLDTGNTEYLANKRKKESEQRIEEIKEAILRATKEQITEYYEEGENK